MLNREENKFNEIAFTDLKEKINRNIVFAFIGAGSSKKLGYPLWHELIKIIEDKLNQKDPTNILSVINRENQCYSKDPLWYAEVLKGYFSEQEFNEIIYNNYRPLIRKANWSLFHQKLLKIPFKHYITTNYDEVLESASHSIAKPIGSFCWNEKTRIRNFFKDLNDPDPNEPPMRYIFHIHGRYDEKDSIILTESDYMGLYAESEFALKVIWSIIASFYMCFIGFRMSDLDVLSIFRRVRWDFGRGDTRHFAIIEVNNLEERKITRMYLRDKFGIEPIFYELKEGTGNLYVEEEKIIDQLLDLSSINNIL